MSFFRTRRLLIFLLVVAYLGTVTAQGGARKARKGDPRQNKLHHLKELLRDKGIAFDEDDITPEQVKALIKKHKLTPRFAEAKRGSGRIPKIHTSDEGERRKQSYAEAKRGQRRTKRKEDWSNVDPEKRAILQQLKKDGIAPSEDLSLEQLQKIKRAIEAKKAMLDEL